MIVIPLAISAAAVVITLCYASFLDIKDRRVPFKTWVPMLVIGLTATGAAFLFFNGGTTLFTGYLGIVSVVMFLAYASNRDEKKPFPLVWALLVSGVQAGSALYFFTIHATGIVILSVLTILIIISVSYFEAGHKENYLTLWWPVMYFLLCGTFWFVFTMQETVLLYAFPAMIAIFCLIFYLFGILGLFGGADAWALIFITLILPVFPFEPLWGYPPLPFFPFTVLVNAVIFNLVAPVGLFIFNVIKKNRAPWPYLFLGYPVEGTEIQNSYGFVIEEFGEENGTVTRRFYKLREALGSVVKGKKRIYTRDLRVHPDLYRKELGIYGKAGKVWISYGIPFIVPITAGVITGLFIGDIITCFLKLSGGI